MQEEIIKQIYILHKEGLNYNQIAKKLKINRCSSRYWLNKESEQEKNRNYRKKKKYNPDYILSKKLAQFQSKRRKHNNQENDRFYLDDYKKIIGDQPKCYLTGELIDLSNSKSYQLDHIIPIAKGGTNKITNCGIVSTIANQSKSDLTVKEFIDLCISVLKNNGYYLVLSSS